MEQKYTLLIKDKKERNSNIKQVEEMEEGLPWLSSG